MHFWLIFQTVVTLICSHDFVSDLGLSEFLTNNNLHVFGPNQEVGSTYSDQSRNFSYLYANSCSDRRVSYSSIAQYVQKEQEDGSDGQT